MTEYTNLENLVLFNETHILISEKLKTKDIEEFLSKYNINFKHYRDWCFVYRNEIIGSCNKFNKCKVTKDNKLLSDVLTELMEEFTKLYGEFTVISEDQCIVFGCHNIRYMHNVFCEQHYREYMSGKLKIKW